MTAARRRQEDSELVEIPEISALPALPIAVRPRPISACYGAIMSEQPTAVRGPMLTFTGDPFQDGLDKTMVHESDAIIVMADGRITEFGPAAHVLPRLPEGIEIRDFGKDALISAGFIDT